MLGRLAVASVVALAVCGPRPVQGAREVKEICLKRKAEWSAFFARVQRAWAIVSDDADRVASAADVLRDEGLSARRGRETRASRRPSSG